MWNASIPCQAPEHTTLHQQHGSTLVLAVLVAGLVASLGVGVAQTFMVNAARVENRLQDLQARQYLLAAEELAVLVLSEDVQVSTSDSLQERWAQTLPLLDTDEGWVQVRLEDAQGRFNLNNLASKTDDAGELGLPLAQRFTAAQQQFMRLLQRLDGSPLTEMEAVALTEALVDWIDTDDQPLGFGGAESLYYVNEAVSYQGANRLLVSPSELRLVRHMTPELYQRLLPLVSVLPEATSLNLNTAVPALLTALVPQTGSEQSSVVDTLLALQHREPFDSRDAALAHPDLAQVLAGQSNLDVKSSYFLLHARVGHEGYERQLESLLWRSEEGVKVVRRRFGAPFEFAVAPAQLPGGEIR